MPAQPVDNRRTSAPESISVDEPMKKRVKAHIKSIANQPHRFVNLQDLFYIANGLIFVLIPCRNTDILNEQAK
jgi:hypothetical protein